MKQVAVVGTTVIASSSHEKLKRILFRAYTTGRCYAPTFNVQRKGLPPSNSAPPCRRKSYLLHRHCCAYHPRTVSPSDLSIEIQDLRVIHTLRHPDKLSTSAVYNNHDRTVLRFSTQPSGTLPSHHQYTTHLRMACTKVDTPRPPIKHLLSHNTRGKRARTAGVHHPRETPEKIIETPQIIPLFQASLLPSRRCQLEHPLPVRGRRLPLLRVLRNLR